MIQLEEDKKDFLKGFAVGFTVTFILWFASFIWFIYAINEQNIAK